MLERISEFKVYQRLSRKRTSDTYSKKVYIKRQKSFITISKIQNMYFRPPNNLYEFPIIYKFLYHERFYDENLNKICKKSRYRNNSE